MKATELRVCVFGPAPYLTVTIERGTGPEPDGADHIHFHPGGQGFWIARMINGLGCRAELVTPLGGESGRVVDGLAGLWGVPLVVVTSSSHTPAYVHDRRDGQRRQVAVSAPASLDRHELDDLYGLVLERSVAAGVCALPGRSTDEVLPLEVYRRLGNDLNALGIRVVGDLHGADLDAVLSRGSLEILKVSDEDLAVDGLLGAGAGLPARLDAALALARRGCRVVVVSAASGPTVAVVEGRTYRVEAPAIDTVDPRGSGDSMTAGLVVGLVEGYDDERLLRFACAAGAANAARHGLGNAKPGAVDAIARQVAVARV